MRTKLLIIFCMILVVFILAGCSIRSVEQPSDSVESFGNADELVTPSEDNDTIVVEVGMTLGECLDSKGVKIYGKSICPYCNAQKEALGEDYDEIPFINCDDYKEDCNRMGIRGYPTWMINGKTYPGQRTRQNLAFLAGCEKYI